MTLPIHSLPVIQNWDCHSCSDCCRTYHVRVSVEERERIEQQNWDEAVLGGRPAIIWEPGIGSDRLNHTADGACVFLGPDQRCRIHARFGPEAKPAACRIYPFTLAPAGDHWRVGLRYACPSAAKNQGRPLPEHAEEVAVYADLLEREAPGAAAGEPPPPLHPGQNLPWEDILRFADTVDDLLADPRVPIGLRIRRVLMFSKLARPVRSEALSGTVRPVLKVLAAAAIEETPSDPASVPPPGWVGRILFRQTAMIYARKDNGPDAGVGRDGKLARFRAAWRFATGRGRIPRLHRTIPDHVRFADAEQPFGELDAESTRFLTRYYRVKVQSMQFCGRTNFNLPFWAGLDSLLLTFPIVMWLNRVLTPGQPAHPLETLQLVVRMVDDNFGFNSVLGTARQNWAVRLLAERGELTRLAAWYNR
jgi:lysine-N-methylase